MKKVDLAVILGITATGKTKLAANLAIRMDGEIISADSRQVYRGMDVGTGKDLSDFVIGQNQVPYHLIDIMDAGEEYNLFEFQTDFLNAYQKIQERNKFPILCGGTGMYIESAIKGERLLKVPVNESLRHDLDQKSIEEMVALLSQYRSIHNTTDSIERERIVRAIEIAAYEKEHQELVRDYPAINYCLFGLHFERSIIKERITKRLKHRLKNEGMIEEVESLIAEGVDPNKLKFYGLEYKFVTQFLLGEISRNELFEKLKIAIHQFSKRQATWYRRMERNGYQINWIDGNLSMEEQLKEVSQVLKLNVSQVT